jgi:Rieske Fe-S protein
MSDERMELETGASRRALLLGGAGAVGATAFLAACGTEDTGSDPSSPPGAAGGSSPPGGASPDEESGDDSGEGDEVLDTTDEVEVGGGVILAQAGVVVTQPTAGDFKGFSAACTHMGCTVSSISDGLINCNCHGSRYSIEDGSVVQQAISGQRPLPAVEISVEGSDITRA